MEDTILSTQITIAGREYLYGKDYMVSARLNQIKNINTTSIVFAGYGISDSMYNDYVDLDVKNAVIVLSSGEPKLGDNYITTGTKRPSAWSSISKKLK